MNDFFKKCKKHGELNINETYKEKTKTLKGFNYRCKYCRKDSSLKVYIKNKQTYIDNSAKWKKQNKQKVIESNKKYYNKNIEIMRRKEKKYRETHAESINSKAILKNVNNSISLEQYKKMFIDQDNKCAICGFEETRISRHGTSMRLCLDHNHFSGKIRKLLCHSCNTGIGKFSENIDLMEKAIQYLKDHKDEAEC